MINAAQSISNASAGPLVVRPYGLIIRSSVNASPSTFNAHSGPMGGFGETVEYGPDYDDLIETGTHAPEGVAPDWLGFSDLHWLSALVPQAGAQATPGFRSLGDNLFRADLIYAPATVPAGRSEEHTSELQSLMRTSYALF